MLPLYEAFIDPTTNLGIAYQEYFEDLGIFFHDEENDKLLRGLDLFVNVVKPVHEQLNVLNAGVANNFNDESILEQLFNTLKNAISSEKTLNFLSAIPSGCLNTFFKNIVTDTNFKINEASVSLSPDKSNVVLNGTTTALGVGLVSLTFLFTDDKGQIVTFLDATLKEADVLWSGAQWLSVGNVGLNININPNADVPVKCSLAFDVTAGFTTRMILTFPSTKGTMTLQTVFSDTNRPSINSLFKFVGGINLESILPSQLQIGSAIELESLSLSYNYLKNKLTYFSYNLTTPAGKRWNLIPAVDITEITLSGSVSNPVDLVNRESWLKIQGNFAIAKGSVSITADIPDLTVNGRMTDNSLPIAISEIVSVYLGDTYANALPACIKSVAIKNLGFMLNEKAGLYNFSIGIEAEWPISIFDKKLFTLTGLVFSITAQKETDNSYKKSGNFGGVVEILGITMSANASYKSDSGWVFDVKQTAGTLNLSKIINDCLRFGWSIDPQYDLEVDGLSLSIATIDNSCVFTGKTAKAWNIPFIPELSLNANFKAGYAPIDKTTKAVITTDPETQNKPFGEISLNIDWHNIDIILSYKYDPNVKCFGMIWSDIHAEIKQDDKKEWTGHLSFTKSFSLGGMIEKMVGWITGRKFGLAAPWDLLNHIDLSGFELTFNFSTRQVSFNINIGPIELGLATIQKIGVCYVPDGNNKGVNIELIGTFLWQADKNQPLAWDASKPENTPTPPGGGNKYLDLRLLAMGQHVTIENLKQKTSVKDAIEVLRTLPEPKPGVIPVGGEGQPVYDPQSSWLVATDFGVMKIEDKKQATRQPVVINNASAAPSYVVALSIIFNDPNMYALRIALDGDAAKVFKGLDFQIMYRKISDTVGCYSSEITLPDVVRNISVGAYTITLPVFGIEVYTNGDFKVDIGFPWNFNFMRSFTVQGIVMVGPIPVPLLGSGGFYFGKLSSVSCNRVPQTRLGTFNPVLVFGVGVQFGVGKYIQYGVLSAGISVTIAGIIEGILAKWNPNVPALNENSSGQIQNDYYFWLQGTAGIIGKLFGSVDFCIIKASVNVELSLMAQLTLESYADIPISVIATVEVALSFTISFWLFSITLHFSFSARIKETFVIRTDAGTAPWIGSQQNNLNYITTMRAKRLRTTNNEPEPSRLVLNWSNLETAPSKDNLTACLLPVLSMYADDAGNDKSKQKAVYIPMLFVDTILPNKSFEEPDPTSPLSSFEKLSIQVLRWTIAAAQNTPVLLKDVDNIILSKNLLKQIQQYLAGKYNSQGEFDPTQKNTNVLLTSDAEAFMANQFLLNIALPTQKMDSATVFAMPRKLGLNVPACDDIPAYNYSFDEFSSANKEYISGLRDYFDQLAVIVEEEMKKHESNELAFMDETGESIASFIFRDYFQLIAKQMASAAQESLRTFKWFIDDSKTLGDIVQWIYDNSGRDDKKLPPRIATLQELLEGNTTHGFNENKELHISGVVYGVGSNGDKTESFETIANEQKTLTSLELAVMNAGLSNVLNPGAQITYYLRGEKKTYPVKENDTLATIAWLKYKEFQGDKQTDSATFNNFVIDFLSYQGFNDATGGSDITRNELLLKKYDETSSSPLLFIKPLEYKTSLNDTLGKIADKYSVTVMDFVCQNILNNNLFTDKSHISIGNKKYDIVSSDTFMSLAAVYADGDINKLLRISDLSNNPELFRPFAKLFIPVYTYYTSKNDTAASVSAKLCITIDDLANHPKNLKINGLFDSEVAKYLNIIHLEQFKLGEIIKEILQTGAIRHLSGMASRYSMHGLRLPTLLPNGGEIKFTRESIPVGEYGIYKITGQQFMLPDLSAGKEYAFKITKADDAKLNWIRFDGDSKKLSLNIQLSDNEKKAISSVYNYAVNSGLKPLLTKVGVQSMMKYTPSQYPFTSVTKWMPSENIVLPYGGTPQNSLANIKLWQIPESLINLPHGEPEAILPRFSIQIGIFNEATSVMESTSSKFHAWGTKTEITIKRIHTEDANPASNYTYELIGANEQDIILLERVVGAVKEAQIDNLTILYPSNAVGGDNGSLISDGQTNFFISQSNLSTETHPPAANGLLALAIDDTWKQPKIDFVRQLWENSITRSGGYYLFYFNQNAKCGFPDYIFNNKGEAKLSLLITYCNNDNCITNYQNCAVTGDTIDISKSVVFAQSDPVPVSKVPDQKLSISDIAAAYYMNPVKLAEDNADHELTPDKTFYIKNGTYYVKLNRPAKAQDIAGYFSIDVNDLINANPQITNWEQSFPLEQSFKLPVIRITVGKSKGGTTFNSLSKFYGLPVGEIANNGPLLIDGKIEINSAIDIAGLFSASSEITIAGGPYASSATISAGCIALEAGRTIPAPIPQTPESFKDDKYGALYLDNTFNLLGYRIKENEWFDKSNIGLPMGPVEKPDNGNSYDKICKPKVPKAAGESWEYQQTVPIYKCLKNKTVENPYQSIGSLFQTDFQWLDPFGNRTITPFDDPTMDPSQSFNGVPVMAGYTDKLTSLSQWQGVNSSFVVNKTDGLKIRLVFDPSKFQPSEQQQYDDQPPWQKAASDALVIYDTLLKQISGTAGAKFFVSSSLLNTREIGTDKLIIKCSGITITIDNWIVEVYNYLSARAAKQDANPPKPLEITYKFDESEVNTTQIFELTVGFKLTRNINYVASEFKSADEVNFAITEINPQVSDGDSGLSLNIFAANFEDALKKDGGYIIKLATGVNREKVKVSGSQKSLWAVRLNLGSKQGISYFVSNPGNPAFFAPVPISNELKSYSKVPMYNYYTGKGIDKTHVQYTSFTGIDMDIWIKQYLSSIDEVLTPDIVSSLGILSQLYATDHLSDIKKIKKSVAESLVTTLYPIYDNESGDMGAAKEAFKQQLLVNLSDFYDTRALIQLQADVNATAESAKLYGTPIDVSDIKKTKDYTLSCAKINLDQPQNKQPITFLLGVPQSVSKEAKGSNIEMNLNYVVTNIEHQIKSVEGIDGYKASSWLSFIKPEKEDGLVQSLGQFKVPVVLRSFPTPPSMVNQLMIPNEIKTDSNSLTDACKWTYGFTYCEDYHYLQDTTYFDVTFNVKKSVALNSAIGVNLFPALARFITMYPAIQDDINSYLSRIPVINTEKTADTDNANVAVIAFKQIIADVSDNLVAKYVVGEENFRSDGTNNCSFSVSESKDAKGRLLITLSQYNRPDIGDPVVKIKIPGDTEYYLNELQKSNNNDMYSWLYYIEDKKGNKKYLSADDGLAITERTIELSGLNILSYQDAKASAHLVRNKYLIEEKETNDQFQYKTSKIEFANPLFPLNLINDEIDIAKIKPVPDKKPMEDYVNDLFTALFKTFTGTDNKPKIQMECRYSYTVNGSTIPINLPIQLLPPTNYDISLNREIAEGIINWFIANNPCRSNGTLWFSLTVMSSLTAQTMPLLRLMSLKLDIPHVTELN
jgi:hypothetical protein